MSKKCRLIDAELWQQHTMFTSDEAATPEVGMTKLLPAGMWAARPDILSRIKIDQSMAATSPGRERQKPETKQETEQTHSQQNKSIDGNCYINAEICATAISNASFHSTV